MATSVSSSYDKVAEEYARRIAGELEGKPMDRRLLEDLARLTVDIGPVCDLGCGPGHVARYLKDNGCSVLGMDLSPGMIDTARALNPDIDFRTGDMLNLDVPNDSWGGIAAFYSVIHVPPPRHRECFLEFYRVLRRGGCALISFHIGETPIHLDEWWGHAVSLDFYFLKTAEVTAALEHAGFSIDRSIERDPYAPDIEHQSRRGYVLARKPPT